MEFLNFIPKTDLARKTRQVLKAVHRGQIAIIRSYGQPVAAILDIVDYRILRAVMWFYANKIEIDPEAGLSHETIAALKEPQKQYDQVIAYYLGEGISLGRAAELLELPWLDLHTRFLRLDVPILVGRTNLRRFWQRSMRSNNGKTRMPRQLFRFLDILDAFDTREIRVLCPERSVVGMGGGQDHAARHGELQIYR